ncbi:hypothetical protein AB1Y20_004393 [Prymnesium parvum]|uniref:Carboxyvinyl-carboxyphosphonate phosphorylmutase n=1 Tax=Prymnesium parvum TaxID=97485 RepID=A0AB34IZ66_PRYPA
MPQVPRCQLRGVIVRLRCCKKRLDQKCNDKHADDPTSCLEPWTGFLAAQRPQTTAERLRRLLAQPGLHLMPCVFDGLSARLCEQAGFPLTFVSGFSVCAAHGLPDTGLLSFAEMAAAMRQVSGALRHTPCIGDGDTGYGNAVSCKRTVRAYAAAGMGGIMIEDQLAPKVCGHTRGKRVVGAAEAVRRVRAAVDAAAEGGGDILVVARTDARASEGLEEALRRCEAFRAAGADVTFLEAPRSVAEMEAYCRRVEGPKMANLLAGGLTPQLPPHQLEQMGFKLAAFPIDLINASIVGMREALGGLRKHGRSPAHLTLPFDELSRSTTTRRRSTPRSRTTPTGRREARGGGGGVLALAVKARRAR